MSGKGLPSVDGVRFTRTALLIDKTITFHSWLQLGMMLEVWEGSYQFWIGDYLNYGQHAFGEKYSQAASPEQAATWTNYAYVAQRIEISRRREVSFGHHQAVAPLEPGEQGRWLQLAIDERLSVHELRKRIRASLPARLKWGGKDDPSRRLYLEVARLIEASFFDLAYKEQARFITDMAGLLDLLQQRMDERRASAVCSHCTAATAVEQLQPDPGDVKTFACTECGQWTHVRDALTLLQS